MTPSPITTVFSRPRSYRNTFGSLSLRDAAKEGTFSRGTCLLLRTGGERDRARFQGIPSPNAGGTSETGCAHDLQETAATTERRRSRSLDRLPRGDPRCSASGSCTSHSVGPRGRRRSGLALRDQGRLEVPVVAELRTSMAGENARHED